MSNDVKKYQQELKNILNDAKKAMQELKDSVEMDLRESMEKESKAGNGQVYEANKPVFFNFSFFKLDPKWRWMADLAKEESAKEVENILKNSGIKFRSYSTLGYTMTYCFCS